MNTKTQKVDIPTSDALAVLAVAGIGHLAIAEHAAWKDRNAKRVAYRKWLKAYRSETGEWYEHGHEPEDDKAHDALEKASNEAQRLLTLARAATRRAIVRIGGAA